MKKTLFLLLTFILLIILTGCMFRYSFKGADRDADNAAPLSTILKPDDVLYYDSVEEAVAHNTLETYDVKHVDEQIKLFQHDNLAVLFFKSNINNKDIIYVLKLYTKEESPKTLFSSPISGTNIFWEAYKTAVEKNKCDKLGEIRLCIELFNSTKSFNADSAKNFIWGLSQTEEVKKLKIEGQTVTQVIAIEMDGETGYFWYFGDLVTDKPLVFADIRKYNEGEIVITMS